jgi:hypothetical protein
VIFPIHPESHPAPGASVTLSPILPEKKIPRPPVFNCRVSTVAEVRPTTDPQEIPNG